MPFPTRDSPAGSRVVAAITATSTATAAARPIAVTSGMFASTSARSAMTTVLPAKTIALPEVATDSATESRTSMPCASWSLCRVTRKSA